MVHHQMTQGPNIRKLIARKMSLLMVPPGTQAGLATAMTALTRPGNIVKVAREATEWVKAAIKAIQLSPGGEAFGDDEAIAGRILAEVEKRLGKK
jgi:hypothetical protein